MQRDYFYDERMHGVDWNAIREQYLPLKIEDYSRMDDAVKAGYDATELKLAAGESCLASVFELVLRLDGTLSGEHGIGVVKRAFVAQEIDPVSLGLMRAIKRQFDPRNILNPGIVFPAE